MSQGYRKLSRTSDQRKALLRDLVTDLIINERITTTEMKAKELSRLADKMITLGKKGTLAARRQAAATVRPETVGDDSNQTAVQKLFADLAPRYATREGGYTRVLKLGPRRGDGAEMAIIEFVE
jgi:large subunit ribosomal protein L17